MKVTGPLFSQAASGSLANTFTAVNQGAVTWMRKHASTPNRRTWPQRAQRARIGFLQRVWALLEPDTQAEWSAIADPTLSAYHTFIRDNLLRWNSGNGPMPHPYPIAQGDTNPHVFLNARSEPGALLTTCTDYGDTQCFALEVYLTSDPSGPIPDPFFIDDQDPGAGYTDVWTFGAFGYNNTEMYKGGVLGYAGEFHWIYGGCPVNRYRVSATWNSDAFRCPTVTYEISDAARSWANVVINQLIPPSGPTYNGWQFQELFTTGVVAPDLRVIVHPVPTDYTVCDCILFEALDPSGGTPDHLVNVSSQLYWTATEENSIIRHLPPGTYFAGVIPCYVDGTRGAMVLAPASAIVL